MSDIVKSLEEALDSKHKFTQSVDLYINLKNIDMSNPANRIDEEILLPHGKGRKGKIGIFASGETAVNAKKICDMVIQPEDIEELAKNKKEAKKTVENIDFFLAEMPLMATVGKSLGKILGPKGKMPKPLPADTDLNPIVERLQNSIRIRSRDKKTLNCTVGKEDMEPKKIADNIQAVMNRVESKLERGKMNVASSYVKTTMGPPIKIG